MRLNKEKVRELMEIYCGGNYNRFARELEVDPSHLYRFINTGVGGGKKLIGGVMLYLKDKDLKFEDYLQF